MSSLRGIILLSLNSSIGPLMFLMCTWISTRMSLWNRCDKVNNIIVSSLSYDHRTIKNGLRRLNLGCRRINLGRQSKNFRRWCLSLGFRRFDGDLVCFPNFGWRWLNLYFSCRRLILDCRSPNLNWLRLNLSNRRIKLGWQWLNLKPRISYLRLHYACLRPFHSKLRRTNLIEYFSAIYPPCHQTTQSPY